MIPFDTTTLPDVDNTPSNLGFIFSCFTFLPFLVHYSLINFPNKTIDWKKKSSTQFHSEQPNNGITVTNKLTTTTVTLYDSAENTEN